MTISHSSAEEMDVPHLVQGMLQLEDSWAGYLLKDTVGEDMPEFLSSLISNYEHMNQFQEETSSEQEKSEPWRNYVTSLNEGLQDRNQMCIRDRNKIILRASVFQIPDNNIFVKFTHLFPYSYSKQFNL